MYFELIIESVILYVSIAGIFFTLLSKSKEQKYLLFLVLLTFFIILALYTIMNKEDNLFSVHFIIVKLIKLVSVIYLYLRTFGIYKEKLQNERIERLNFLNPINHAEIRNIINEDEEEIELIIEKADGLYQKSLLSKEILSENREKIERFFENNKNKYLDSEFNLDSLSKHTKVARQDLSQTFSISMNTTFNSYLNEKRIKYACDELKKNNDISIVILSEMCGYKSRASLYRNFIIVKGISIAEFKKQLTGN
jgi:AraC-like DNA-binding protein